MSYKPDEKDWMAYLYNELEEEHRRKVEQFILQHPEAAEELDRLRTVRKALASVDDKEVIAPSIVIGHDRKEEPAAAQRSLWTTPWLRAVAAVAASVVVIILAGRLTGAQLSISDDELRISFGPQQQRPVSEAVPVNILTEADVRGMIDASLEQNNSEIQEKLDETRSKLDASIRSNLALNSGKMDQLVREVSSASQEQIRQFVDGIRTENMQQVKDYFQLTSTEQKKYIENLLVDFSKYLQQQRNDDLRLVQMRMNSLEQNTDIFKQETEQILSSIITTVGVPVSGEMKN